jgi:hypothetical protein
MGYCSVFLMITTTKGNKKMKTKTKRKKTDRVVEKFHEWKHDIYESNRTDWNKSDDKILKEMFLRIEKGGAYEKR